MKLSQTKFVQSLAALFGTRVRTDCQCTLSLYGSGEDAEPECTHRWHGNMERSLGKLLALLACLVLLLSLLRGICRLLSRC